MYKSVVSLLSLLSMSNAQTSTMAPTTYVCGSQQQSADYDISIYLAFDYDADMVYITLTGPSDQYFAVGIGTEDMPDAYAVVVDGDGTVRERKISSTGAGDVLTPSVTELANYVEDGVRTVLLSRAVDGAGADYFTFTEYDAQDSLPMIWATADTVTISPHSTTDRGDDNPVANFIVDSDGTDMECGALESEGDFDTTMAPADDMDTTADMDYTYYCGTQQQDATLGISVSVAVSETTAYLTLQGPDGQYFGIGFGQATMADAYAIIVDGDGTVSERKLGSGVAGDLLTSSVTEVSNEVVGTVRTVYLTRPLAGTSADYYTFTFDAADLDIIWGSADTNEISAHTSVGNTSPIDSFVGSDGTDATCGNLAIADTDDDSAVSYGITVTFGLLLAVLPFLA